MTVLISILYYQSNTGAQQIQNMQGAIFFICIFLAFNGVFQVRQGSHSNPGMFWVPLDLGVVGSQWI